MTHHETVGLPNPSMPLQSDALASVLALAVSVSHQFTPHEWKRLMATHEGGEVERCDLIAHHVVQWITRAMTNRGVSTVDGVWDAMSRHDGGVPLYDAADEIYYQIRQRLHPAAHPPADVVGPVCRYTLHRDGDDVVQMLPQCCAAEPDPFNAMEEPHCRYCGALVVCEDASDDDDNNDETEDDDDDFFDWD